MKLEHEMQETRLMFYERILQDVSISVKEVDNSLLTLTRDASSDDHIALAVLRACVHIAETNAPAMKRNLKVVLVHDFSRAGSPVPKTLPLDISEHVPRIYEIVGQRLSWREAAVLFRANPEDDSAHIRALVRLQEECKRQWTTLFGDPTGGPFEVVTSAA